MKSGNRNKLYVQDFWFWFGSISDALAENFENQTILNELDRRSTELHPSLSWEIGPGVERECMLAISPNLDLTLLTMTKHIISFSPNLKKWEFYPARQPKNWNYLVEFLNSDHEPVVFDISSWGYVLLEYPDGIREILLVANRPISGDNNTRLQVASIALESILGEESFLEKVGHFEIVDQLEPEFKGKEKSIKHLKNAFS